VQRRRVNGGVNRDWRDVQIPAGANDADCNFSAVGD
jgi:hypothetical protein